MKYKLSIIPIAIVFLAIGIWLITAPPQLKDETIPTIQNNSQEILPPSEETPVSNNINTQSQSRQPIQIPEAEQKSSRNSTPSIKITLKAGQFSQTFDIPSGSTVYEAMKILRSAYSFTFKDKYYSGLGYLIQEINGVPSANGTYWTLYINEKYSIVGASDYKLSEGDIVEWRYEKQ